MDLPAVLQPENRDNLLAKIHQAGEMHLSPAQTSILLGLSEKQTQILWHTDPDIAGIYAVAHLEQQITQMKTMVRKANDSDNPKQFEAAKYLYELFSGNRNNNQNNTFNISVGAPADVRRVSDNIKLAEVLDAETVEKISND